jgi:hypothetical protein
MTKSSTNQPIILAMNLSFSAISLFLSRSCLERETPTERLNAFWAEHLGHWYDKYLQAIATDSAVEIIRSWAILLQTELSRLFRDVPLKSMTTGLEEEKVAPPKSMKKDDPS